MYTIVKGTLQKHAYTTAKVNKKDRIENETSDNSLLPWELFMKLLPYLVTTEGHRQTRIHTCPTTVLLLRAFAAAGTCLRSNLLTDWIRYSKVNRWVGDSQTAWRLHTYFHYLNKEVG
jgi:hypothetical protein